MSDPIKLLFVDDDTDIRTVVVMSLKLDPSIDIKVESTGTAALAILNEGSWKPDIVLLDVMMPDMDGPTLTAEIRAIPGFEHVPVIFMTARARNEDLARYQELGAAGVITKPFDPLQLASGVRSILARHHNS